MSFVEELIKELNIKPEELMRRMQHAPSAYKTYSIAKRSGGKREISQPSPEIKDVQRAVVNVFLSKFEVSEAATAYIPEKSIVDNAEPHLGRKFILKMDFKEFFPSIKPEDLRESLNLRGVLLSNMEQYILSRFLFKASKNGLRLTIGAPSSPCVSNLVMFDIDKSILSFCKDLGVTYTRYADDLTFSFDGAEKSQQIQDELKKLIERNAFPKLTLNNEKTRLIGKGRSQRVTGIVLTNDNKVSVGRHTRKKLRALCHHFHHGSLAEQDIPFLHGLISHVRSIEPEFYEKLEKKYGKSFFLNLAKKSFAISNQ